MTNRKTDANTGAKNASIQEALLTLGLSNEQALVYQILSENGPSRAQRIALNAAMTRPLAYKVLDQLLSLGLVEKRPLPHTKTATFAVMDPRKLEALVSRKKETFEKAEYAYEHSITQLTSLYNLASKKPNIRFFEGTSGIKRVFDDILKERKDLLIFRSVLDNNTKESAELIDTQRVKQFAAGINLRVVSPRVPTSELVEKDKKYNISRRYIPEQVFSLPAQIIIYGDKVAITSYENIMVTTIIQNTNINQSFRVLFELLWSMGADQYLTNPISI